MEILRAADAPIRRLGEGDLEETRATFDAQSIRMVITRIPSGHTQNWHRHERLVEATYVLEGEIEIAEAEPDEPETWIALGAGDFVVFHPDGRTTHTSRNVSGATAVTLTVKVAAPLDLDPAEFAALGSGDWIARAEAGPGG